MKFKYIAKYSQTILT